MRYVTKPVPTNTTSTKLVPAPNAHKMMQRMAMQRQHIQSKTQMKAQASSFVETKQDPWIEDVGDRVEYKLEYSTTLEEEGETMPKMKNNVNTRVVQT